jgi:hypothetical protein
VRPPHYDSQQSHYFFNEKIGIKKGETYQP